MPRSRDTTLRVWNAQSGQELCSLRGHTSSVNAALLLSAEQTRVLSSRLGCPAAHRIAVSGSSDCYLNLWLALQGTLVVCWLYEVVYCGPSQQPSDCCHRRLWDVFARLNLRCLNVCTCLKKCSCLSLLAGAALNSFRELRCILQPECAALTCQPKQGSNIT